MLRKVTSSRACATYVGDVFCAARIMVITLLSGVDPTDNAVLCRRAVFIMTPEMKIIYSAINIY